MGWDKIGNLSSGLRSRAAATVAIGTTSTATGLSLPVLAGTYRLVAYLPLVLSGSPTNTRLDLTGPTVASAGWAAQITRWAGTTATVLNVRPTAGAALSISTGATTHASTDLVAVEGAVTFSAAGTVAASLTRTGGTSSTLQVGAFLQLIRIE